MRVLGKNFLGRACINLLGLIRSIPADADLVQLLNPLRNQRAAVFENTLIGNPMGEAAIFAPFHRHIAVAEALLERDQLFVTMLLAGIVGEAFPDEAQFFQPAAVSLRQLSGVGLDALANHPFIQFLLTFLRGQRIMAVLFLIPFQTGKI